ncbi:protein of unknown function [Pseudorhizobium banfieldiae]|uniref:Right handed beta helix domain-containing protein n=1 Tax=Pseudorhizobium banfieldiae TaxID=1125847 RepID=L0NE82_9HYPH|nr:glycosyl hydrolase family 28 protein [Pseudorhizobium banfieldiae]CAD6606256.1 hypothetical protein RNT25_01824 [arsenite-oxidising bacterium NT-25]CCF19169.1 protein of unknown function [Pseudorhizobium banfieldiae]
MAANHGPLAAYLEDMMAGNETVTGEAHAVLSALRRSVGILASPSFANLGVLFSYGVAPGRLPVGPGDVVEVPRLGASYDVVAPDATEFDLDFTSSGGVKLNVRRRDGAYYAVDFGAAGDLSADDLIPVQKAVYKGGLVRLHQHYLSGGVKYRTKTTIEGYGYDNSFLSLDPAVNDDVLSSEGTGLEDVTLRRFGITGNYVNDEPIKGHHGLIAHDIAGLTIEGIGIKDTKEFAALIWGCRDFMITENRVRTEGINRDGFKLLSSRGGTFTGNDIESGDDCVSVSGEADFAGNVVIGMNRLRSTYARCVYVNTTQAVPGPVGKTTVIGNICDHSDTTAIVVEIYDGPERIGEVMVTKNQISGFGKRVNNPNGRLEAVRVTGKVGHLIKKVMVDENMITLDGAPTDQVAKLVNVTLAEDVSVCRNTIELDQEVLPESAGIQIGSENEPVYDFAADGNRINMKGHGSYGMNISRASDGTTNDNKIKGAPIAIRGIGDATNPCTDVSARRNKITDPYGVMQKAIATLNNSSDWTAEGNDIKNAAIAKNIDLVGTGNRIRGNKGFATSNRGTFVIPAAANVQTISHFLQITPPVGSIKITPITSLGAASKWRIPRAEVTGGTFKVYLDVNPGVDVSFEWEITD